MQLEILCVETVQKEHALLNRHNHCLFQKDSAVSMLLPAGYHGLWSLKPNIHCFLEDALKNKRENVIVLGNSCEKKG